MNRAESQVIKYFEQTIVSTVDPIKIINAIGYLKPLCDRDLRSSQEEIWGTLLPKIISVCSFASFWLALFTSGYERLSVELLVELWKHNLNTKLMAGPGRTKSEQQAYFLLLKTCYHDGAFKEPHELLESKLNSHKEKFENSHDTTEKMRFADLYADCLCVIIDTKAMEFVEDFPSHKFFDDLKALIPATSNPSLTQVAYCSRMAIAYGMVDQIDEGRKFMAEAQVAAFQTDQTAQYVYNMLYIHIHFLCMQATVPNQADIDGIISIANRFLDSIPDDDEEAVFWKKMVVLRVACLLLGISHKGCINERQKIEREQVDKAKAFLKVIDAHWEGIEYIRRVFYFVCQARIRELEFQWSGHQHEQDKENLKNAISQLQGTLAKDKDKNFRETPLAQKYIDRLNNLIGNV